jgi:hypothetical protein
MEVEALFSDRDHPAHAELRGTTLLLVAGVQYLLVRSRKLRVFGGVDVSSDAGWKELKTSIAVAAARMFPEPALRLPRARANRR